MECERSDELGFDRFERYRPSSACERSLMALNRSTEGSLFRTIVALLRSAGSNSIARATADRNFIEPWFLSSTNSSGFTLLIVVPLAGKMTPKRNVDPRSEFPPQTAIH